MFLPNVKRKKEKIYIVLNPKHPKRKLQEEDGQIEAQINGEDAKILVYKKEEKKKNC